MMRRRHKIALGASVAALASMLTAGVQVWDRYQTWRQQHVAQDNQRDFECAVRLCRAQGGRWWQGECRARR